MEKEKEKINTSRKEKRQKWWANNKNAKREEKREGLRKNPTTVAEKKFTILPSSAKNKSGFKSSTVTKVISKSPESKNSSSKVVNKTSEKQSKLDFKKVKSVPNSKNGSTGKTKMKPKSEPKTAVKPNVHIAGELPPSEHASKSYVLFIGNLPYSVTKEQLEEHFKKTGGVKGIRIPTDKATGQCKGFAYIEFKDRISHGIALRLHQTTLCGRKINVEFTSIGGKNKKRLDKLKMKNLARANFKKPLES